ncbi:MAG: hypothetical protein ACI85E_001389 [Marinomonas primoryensis]|jgi:uncharacterized protein (TIGR02421 family)
MQMQSEAELLAALAAGETFEATLIDDDVIVRVREYVPYVCTAIHAGHRMRDSLIENSALSDSQRLREEDPYTDQLIDSFPITLVSNRSRYEYDLNRTPEHCIYDTAWDQQVWQQPLSDDEKQLSMVGYERYYRILKAILTVLEKKFGGSLLIDVHSYNWQIRQHEYAPIFNIGTKQVDVDRWGKSISVFEQHLTKIELPNLDIKVERNVVFQGKGNQATFIKQNYHNTLIIPLEIKKIFMDEENGEAFPLVMEKLQEGLYLAVLEVAATFNHKLKHSKLNRSDLLSSDIEPIVRSVDKALYRLAKNIETLHYVNPTNIQQEKKRFLAQRGYNPSFRYRQLRLDPYEFREKLYKLPVSQIQDPFIRSLYRSVVDSYATKVELLTTVGTPQFLYNSLRYYGEPSEIDIANARFILHAGHWPTEQVFERNISAQDAKVYFEQAANDLQLDCRVVVSNRLVAKAMVDNSRKMLLINRNAVLSKMEVDALIHHELGVHMVTTMNAIAQPLQVFQLGLPGNTYTQEGLAILSEYLSGNIDLNRLQQLSLRVLAVNMMVKGKDFSSVFARLRDEYNVSVDAAFSLTMRVFRGGGFTKDFLYLSGFRDLVAMYKTRDISSLLIGKTGIQFIDTLDSLVARGIIHKPKHMTPAIANVMRQDNAVLDYLVDSIR